MIGGELVRKELAMKSLGFAALLGIVVFADIAEAQYASCPPRPLRLARPSYYFPPPSFTFPDYYVPHTTQFYRPVEVYYRPVEVYYRPVQRYYQPVEVYYRPVQRYYTPVTTYFSGPEYYYRPPGGTVDFGPRLGYR